MSNAENTYDVGLFLNRNEAANYLCVICQNVFNDATSIGCNEDHMFCKACLNAYCQNRNQADTIQCPSCRQRRLPKNRIRASKFTDRIVRDLMVKCKLQYEQQNNNIIQCNWTGPLSALHSHIYDQCQLFPWPCEACYTLIKRYEAQEHDRTCTEREILCHKNCKKRIKRKQMNYHISEECEMTELSCDDCKVEVLRKNMNHHKSECPEVELECEFFKYGCLKREKRRLMARHLAQAEIKHLKLKVSYLERQIEGPKSDSHYLLLLLQSNCYMCTLKSKHKQTIHIESFMKKQHAHYCIAKNIGFSKTKQIGFDVPDIDIITNDVVFGVSKNKISACSVNNTVCKTFQGDLPIKCSKPFYSENCGLMIIGGSNTNCTIPNKDIWNIQFNDGRFSKLSLTTFPYSAVNVSVCEILHNLFVCGGWWNKSNLSTCCMYSLGNQQWTNLKNMNHSHQTGGICVWKERGNKIVVSSETYVEEYDTNKNTWIDLPCLNNTTDMYPALLTLNNLLFCIGGVSWENDNLGHIELYDPRDTSNKWIYVSTVENYFNIPKDKGAGFNCFLPI